MKSKLTLLTVFGLLFFISNTYSQDVPDWTWKTPITRVVPTGEYSELPTQDQLKYENPNKTTRVIHTAIGDISVAPNVRPFPHTATQSEVDAKTMGGNGSEMFASWNSFGPSFFGTGFCLTTNEGVSWTGNFQMFSGNNGDPGPWIWPTSSTWAGRLGISVIGTSAMVASFSTDNGTTWSAPATMGGTSVDKNLSAVDMTVGSPFYGRAYTVWTDFAGTNTNRIVGSYSTNGGVSWTGYAPVSPVPAAGHHCQGCDVAVGPGGVVYVIWAHCTTNGQNSTEDNLGFAKSTDGGVSWTISNNNVVDINGIRSASLFNGIRANGFPRLAIDKSGGANNGWIYAITCEKTIAPATDVADVCLCRSTDGGTSWTHTRVNQDTPGNGRYQYEAVVCVDNGGGVNVGYYDQRNTTGVVTEYWMSRSVNGGVSWTDVAVSDHSFTPAPISGLAGGYQGDYTGITASTSKVWPFWADNSSGIYQVWTSGISTGPPPAHDIIAGPFLSLPAQLLINTPYNIKAKFTNGGTSNETAIPCKYFVDGVLINTTNINLNASQADSVNNSWQTPAAGNHTLKYVCSLATDVNHNNDTVTVVVNVLPSVPVIHQDVFCHGGLNIPIPDLGTAVDNIVVNVSNSTTVTDVNVRIDSVFHTYDGDLQFQLTKGSTTVNFIQNAGTSGDNFIGTILNDSASTPIAASGVAPFTGSFQPSLPLAGFNGATLNGTWTLTITDQAGQDSGVLKAWCLVISYNALVGGISTIEVPNYYSLGQNYPNPFNPSTNIKYTIPKAGLVTLKIYDVVGREVATLVNEVKNVGVYNVDFNASNLSSGVYFYKIQAGDFSSIKKMVLVK